MKVPEVGGVETFDKVFFNAARGSDDCRDVFVFDEVEDDFAEAGGDEVRSVAEEDCAAGRGADFGGGVVGRFVFG